LSQIKLGEIKIVMLNNHILEKQKIKQ